MPRRSLVAPVLALALLSTTACYRAVVETGRAAGPTVVQKNWVNTFVFGLVPAKPIDVTAQCPAGVARVETQQTFLNGLVGALTLGIYAPQSATITCAASRTGALDPRVAPLLDPAGHAVVEVAAGAPSPARDAALDAALRSAAESAARTGQPVFVRF